MITLNDAALVMALASVLLALQRWPRASLALSVASAFYSLWGWRVARWRRRAEAED